MGFAHALPDLQTIKYRLDYPLVFSQVLITGLEGAGIGVPSDHKQPIGPSDLRIATDKYMLAKH